jgi:DNA-binding CsgD family transcriptional regulator
MVKQSEDIVNLIQRQVRDLARDPARRQNRVLATNIPGGTAYVTGLDSTVRNRTLVCCVFNNPRELTVRGRLAADRTHLTPTQTQVAFMIANRLSNQEIAQSLGASPHTVRRHTEQVLQRLQVKRRREVEPVLRQWLAQALHDSIEQPGSAHLPDSSQAAFPAGLDGAGQDPDSAHPAESRPAAEAA